MNIVEGFDIDTVEGSEAYLKKNGVDVENCVKDGLQYIEEVKKRIKLKNNFHKLLINKNDPKFEIIFRDQNSWTAYDYQLTSMVRDLVVRHNELIELLKEQLSGVSKG